MPAPKTAKRKLDASDIATILASLRMFQKRYEDCDATVIINDWPDHFSSDANDGKPGAPLGSDDIDDLCEQINFGEVEL